jgi:hypothetical protein
LRGLEATFTERKHYGGITSISRGLACAARWRAVDLAAKIRLALPFCLAAQALLPGRASRRQKAEQAEGQTGNAVSSHELTFTAIHVES